MIVRCACGGSCPRCKPQPASLARTQNSETHSTSSGGLPLAIQLDSDPSPPSTLVLDPDVLVTSGNEPIFDDGEAAAALGPSSDSEVEEPEAVQTSAIEAVSPRVGRVAPDRIASKLGNGVELDPAVRTNMSDFFGRNFDRVRIHTNDRADALANSFRAYAFTVGDHIAFAAGQYRPALPEGQKLIAHELTHVLQQRGGLGSEIRRRGIGAQGDRYEVQAERNAEYFANGAKSECESNGQSHCDREMAVQFYSGSAAASYARTWALSTNSSYPRNGNDCTNFASQAVLAGGWTMAGGSCGDRTDDVAWWYGDWNCWYPGVNRSYTWAGAQNFFNFLSTSGRGSTASYIYDLNVGDVLQVAHGGHVGHTTIVTGKDATTGNLLLSYHTRDSLDVPVWGQGGFLSRYAGQTDVTFYAWKL